MIRSPARAVLVVSLCCIAAGCQTSAPGTPRARFGALPFPGLFTLYATADPEKLGRHRYGTEARWFQKDETSRGIIYTTRGGFIDLAHVRITIDWIRYCTQHVRRALEQGESTLALHGTNFSVFHLTFDYPPDWRDLPADERARLVDELSLRIGQRLGYLMWTWHELISWYGYRIVAVVDERPSAFTYDDICSHALGVRVADRAMRDTSRTNFDDAVTAALRAELRALGAVSPRRTKAAARAVEGIWWEDGKPLKRQLDETLAGVADDGAATIRPWIVPDLPFARDAQPVEFTLPSLADVFGRDFRGVYSVAIAPGIEQAGVMRRQLASRPTRFTADEDIPALLRAARAQMRRQFAAGFDQPFPAAAAVNQEAMPASPARDTEPPSPIPLAAPTHP